MRLKERLREKALEMGFEDMGFTGIEPLDLYIKEIESRPKKMYGWVQTDRFNTVRAAAIAEKHPWAKSLLVLIRNYHRRAFPPQLAGKIGRCYQVDERKEKGSECLDLLHIPEEGFQVEDERRQGSRQSGRPG